MSGSQEMVTDGDLGEILVHNCGCTANLMLITDTELYVANAGDCRCVLATFESAEKIIAKDLSVDHKPDLESEKTRIEKAGGFVK